jgi:hypothetical protein
MTRHEQKKPTRSNESKPDESAIDSSRLTPQGRAAPGGGEDSTDPKGQGAKKGQSDKADG